jgi:hypothetical protein
VIKRAGAICFLLLGSAAACSDENGPPCTFDDQGAVHWVGYTLTQGDEACAEELYTVVILQNSDQEACTTACMLFGEQRPCDTTFTCTPGDPYGECSGDQIYAEGPNCQYELRMLGGPPEGRAPNRRRR